MSQETGEWTPQGLLEQVAEAAGARLRADTDEDADAERPQLWKPGTH